jgi:hypothetical protein
MSKPLLPLCSIPKLADRDGHTGMFAKLALLGAPYGYWFASGAQYNFQGSVRQTPGEYALVGTKKPNTYSKGEGSCLGGGTGSPGGGPNGWFTGDWGDHAPDEPIEPPP